jgi:hypothetical protein
MNVSVRKRARQRASLMQAELDGRGQAIATPAFIAPAQLKPDLRMSGEGGREIGGEDRGAATLRGWSTSKFGDQVRCFLRMRPMRKPGQYRDIPRRPRAQAIDLP